MIDLRRAGLFGAMLLSAAMTAAACGGSAATPAPGDTTPAPAETTDAPAITDAPAATDAPVTPAPLPTFDVSALTGAIPGVDSYRTSFSVGGVEQYQSVVVTKPELSKAITTFSDGVADSRYIFIGKRSWMATGADGAFEAIPEQLASSMLLLFDPTAMIGAYAQLDFAGSAIDVGTEQKNDVSARHLRIDSTTIIGAAAQMPAGSAIDIWVAEAGYLIAWEMTGFGESDVSIQVTGVNDPANKVESPE